MKGACHIGAEVFSILAIRSIVEWRTNTFESGTVVLYARSVVQTRAVDALSFVYLTSVARVVELVALTDERGLIGEQTLAPTRAAENTVRQIVAVCEQLHYELTTHVANHVERIVGQLTHVGVFRDGHIG